MNIFIASDLNQKREQLEVFLNLKVSSHTLWRRIPIRQSFQILRKSETETEQQNRNSLSTFTLKALGDGPQICLVLIRSQRNSIQQKTKN